jgi:hypothetical protein
LRPSIRQARLLPNLWRASPTAEAFIYLKQQQAPPMKSLTLLLNGLQEGLIAYGAMFWGILPEEVQHER